MIDWGEGEYERTAAELLPASEAVVARLAPGAGERVLDAGCGTGNEDPAAFRATSRYGLVEIRPAPAAS